MKNKSLQVRKENLFTKAINFVKRLFKSKMDKVIDNEVTTHKNCEATKSNFINEIRLEKQENSELIKLQQQFENDEIDLCDISNEDIHNLNLLYSKQIDGLKKKRDDKKTELNMIKHRIKNYSSNM